MKMRHQQWFRSISLVFLMVSVVLIGCKKNVAATPPAPSVQPAVPAPAPTITLRATPAAIDRGQPTSLQWEARNATSVHIEPELGNVQNQGSRSVSPSSSVTYTATATGPGGSAADSARITVRIPAAAAAAPPQPRPEAAVSVSDLFRQNMQPIYFDYDKAEVRPDQISRLQADAFWLKSHLGLKFTIEGNCDERGSEEYNLGLGDRRANVVKEFLIKEGVEASSMKTVSYGEEHPVCKETTEECYQRNRRAAFELGPVS
jgi:peptidoglycan-associated lipoprotein